eukprot:g9065.t1
MDRERSKPRTPRRCQKDRTPSPRQPLRLDKDTTREKSNWSPCKWPPSSRWPSTQLPQNVNNWPLAKGDKPTGHDTHDNMKQKRSFEHVKFDPEARELEVQAREAQEAREADTCSDP